MKGYSTKKISNILNIKVITVQSFYYHILKSLNLKSRSELFIFLYEFILEKFIKYKGNDLRNILYIFKDKKNTNDRWGRPICEKLYFGLDNIVIKGKLDNRFLIKKKLHTSLPEIFMNHNIQGLFRKKNVTNYLNIYILKKIICEKLSNDNIYLSHKHSRDIQNLIRNFIFRLSFFLTEIEKHQFDLATAPRDKNNNPF